MVSWMFSFKVKNTAGPCFFWSISVNASQILHSFNHVSYEVLFSKEDWTLKFDAISGSLLSLIILKYSTN